MSTNERVHREDERIQDGGSPSGGGSDALDGVRSNAQRLIEVARKAVEQTRSGDSEGFLQSNRQVSAQ